jgi:hypothetical protein
MRRGWLLSAWVLVLAGAAPSLAHFAERQSSLAGSVATSSLIGRGRSPRRRRHRSQRRAGLRNTLISMTARSTIVFALLLGARTALAYSPCEDVSIGEQKIANPLKSEAAPTTLVCNSELATVSDDSAVITWVTNRTVSSTVECWGIDGSDCSPPSGDPALYHAVEIKGLRPGTVYYYRIETDGLPALPTLQSPGIFRTFDRPGNYLFSFASLNDMHVGETVSGQLTSVGDNPIPPSFKQASPPYWKVMNEGAVAGINARGVAFTITKGDLTSGGTETETAEAKSILVLSATFSRSGEITTSRSTLSFPGSSIRAATRWSLRSTIT